MVLKGHKRPVNKVKRSVETTSVKNGANVHGEKEGRVGRTTLKDNTREAGDPTPPQTGEMHPCANPIQEEDHA